MLRIVKFLREYKKYSDDLKSLEAAAKTKSKALSIGKIGLFFCSVFIVCHLGACIWIIIARLNENSMNWLLEFGYVDYDDFELWVVSMYFCVTTITTVGYGDIYAISTEERILGAIFKLFGVCLFSITSGTLTQLIMNADAQEAKIKEKLAVISAEIYQ
jgi:hypothetical protein